MPAGSFHLLGLILGGIFISITSVHPIDTSHPPFNNRSPGLIPRLLSTWLKGQEEEVLPRPPLLLIMAPRLPPSLEPALDSISQHQGPSYPRSRRPQPHLLPAWPILWSRLTYEGLHTRGISDYPVHDLRLPLYLLHMSFFSHQIQLQRISVSIPFANGYSPKTSDKYNLECLDPTPPPATAQTSTRQHQAVAARPTDNTTSNSHPEPPIQP